MHLRNVEISNFRLLTDFKAKFKDGVNLLIGPNAVGKTTVMEAIRLAKSVLAPRTPNETRMVLVSLGATSQQLPQSFNYGAIAGDTSQPIKIICEFSLSDDEIAILPELSSRLARDIVASQFGISLMQEGQLALVQFLSSPVGQSAMQAANNAVQLQIGEMTLQKSLKLTLNIDPKGGFSGENLFHQSVFAQMENRLSPYRSSFSYFPADRAMPAGDTPIQLGVADAQQQLESHNSQAFLKYQRLKSTIFSSFVESEQSRTAQKAIFDSIFLKLLKEKKLEGINLNQYGQATIQIRDVQSNKTFDIDSLSSGEKGLVLTLLLIGKSMQDGGVILIDEPELHLNSAVCKDLIGFLAEDFLTPRNIQAIICTHSPEIIASAMRRDDATVFHLKKGSAVAPIRKQDQPELVQALRLLGSSEIEELLYEGIIFVEGDDDVELLELAFPESRSRFKLRPLQGRGEVEKLIKELQKAEAENAKESVSYFLFDRDRSMTALTSSPKVKISQWDRYCLENYLLDQEILFDVITREFKTEFFPAGIGDANTLFQRVAMKQLTALVIEEAYRELAYANAELRLKDKNAGNFDEAAVALFGRLEQVKNQVTGLEAESWKSVFIGRCNELLKQREAEWAGSWQVKCSGKQFLFDLRKECKLKVGQENLKRRLLIESKVYQGGGSESWKLLNAKFQALIS